MQQRSRTPRSPAWPGIDSTNSSADRLPLSGTQRVNIRWKAREYCAFRDQRRSGCARDCIHMVTIDRSFLSACYPMANSAGVRVVQRTRFCRAANHGKLLTRNHRPDNLSIPQNEVRSVTVMPAAELGACIAAGDCGILAYESLNPNHTPLYVELTLLDPAIVAGCRFRSETVPLFRPAGPTPAGHALVAPNALHPWAEGVWGDESVSHGCHEWSRPHRESGTIGNRR